MRLFLDPSALAKRYLEEAGTPSVVAYCAQATDILLCVTAIPEIISAFNRLHREKKLTTIQYRRLKSDFARDIEQATIVELSDVVIRHTIQCLEAAPLRALDALHIGCALSVRCDLFLSADRQQIKAAKRMQLVVQEI